MYLLDSDVLIDLQHGLPSAKAWFSSLLEAPSVPGLVIMEVIQDAKNERQVQQMLLQVRPLPIVWPTEEDCNQALASFLAFHLSHGLGLLDSLIGACAVGLSATLCTFNVRHYRAIPELVTEQPYKR